MIGHITDGLGMLRAIEEQGITTKQADVLILGSGGAARVAGYEFLAKGGRVTFAVRNKQKERNWSTNWLIRKKTGITVFPFVRSTIVQVRMIF